MNTPLTHSPIYKEPADYTSYCPQAAPQRIDHTTRIILHYFDQVKSMLVSQIKQEPDNNYKSHLIGRLYEIAHLEYILETNKLDIPRDI